MSWRPHQAGIGPKSWRIHRMVNASVVGISGVLAMVAVLIVFTFPHTGCGCADTTSEPLIQLTSAEPQGKHSWETRVADVSRDEELSGFKAVLLRNGAQTDVLDSLAGSSHSIDFVDADAGGTLSGGDYFTVACNPDSTYELFILWKDSGNVRGSVEWVTELPDADPLD